MADVDIQLGYKNAAWFATNAAHVLEVGQIVYLEQTGTYKLGDGTSVLSALSFLGASGSGVQTVTGDGVDNTDPLNPVLSFPTPNEIGAEPLKGADDNYVTDAQLTVIQNTSGTNTGDDATNSTSNTYADSKVADAINDGTTTIAPSQNAVFDALALKANVSDIPYDFASARYSGVDYNGASGAITVGLPGINILYGMPVVVGEPHTITAIKVEVTTNVAGGKIRLGLYTENSVGYPSTLVEESTELNASSNGIKTYTFSTPRAVTGRKYFIGFVCNSSAIQVRYISGGANLIANNGANAGFLYRGAFTYGALPNPFSAGFPVNTSGPSFLITKQ